MLHGCIRAEMTKAELIERIARSRDLPPDITKKDIAQILGLAFDELAAYFGKAKVTKTSSPRFTFPRFGTFTKKRRSARRGVNPRTLEPMQIDACHTLDFKASRELRDLMNRPETVARRTPAKAGSKRTSKSAARSKEPLEGAPSPDASGPGRRRLTPRDEEAELDALIDDEALFEEEPALPESPMKRVRGSKANSRARTG